MSPINALRERSHNQCELCQSSQPLSAVKTQPDLTLLSEQSANVDYQVYICDFCENQLKHDSEISINHWRHLPDLMWSAVPAIQIISYRLLHRINEPWARDALDSLYLEDGLKQYADKGLAQQSADFINSTPTLDSNGVALAPGDSVTLIKDLVVKGAGFTAKRGTAVRNISLTNNPLHVEGRVNGVRIVLVADFLKKMA